MSMKLSILTALGESSSTIGKEKFQWSVIIFSPFQSFRELFLILTALKANMFSKKL